MNSTTVKAPPAAVRLTLDYVYLIAAIALLALRPLLTPIPQNDFWWHMATGRIIATQGLIPATDTFSYTRAGEEFFNQGWLAQLLMYTLHTAGGLALVVIVQAIVIALAYGLLLRLCLLRTSRLRLSVVLLLLATMPLSFDNWTVRPQSYAFPIFAAFLTVLTEYRLGRANRLWLLPVLMLLWVNVHGSFVLGLAMIGIVFAGGVIERLHRMFSRRSVATAVEIPAEQQLSEHGQPTALLRLMPLLGWGAATALAVLANPRGPGVLVYVKNLLGSSQVTNLVTEWAPPSIRMTGGLIFFLFVGICFLAIAYSPRKPEATDMLLFFAFLWLGLGAVRNIVWFGFVATPLLVSMATALLPPPRKVNAPGTTSLNAILVGFLSLLVIAGLPWVKPALFPPSVGAIIDPQTPVAAVEYLQSQPARPAHLFHAMDFGSYLIWSAPEQKVFIDPRIELYPIEQWRDYLNLSDANNIPDLLRKYQIDGALLSIDTQQPLVDALAADPGWDEQYRDEHTVYFRQK